jgi:glycyl-tRNA synthetase
VRRVPPFGLAQCGKAFRNEISTSNFIFRTREFDQMELQWFSPQAEDVQWYAYWVDQCHDWLLSLGISPHRVRRVEHAEEELAHYALATTDLEFKFPFGWGELWGIANRGCYDLKRHEAATGVPLTYAVPGVKGRHYPHVIEPALGLNRLVYALLADACQELPMPDGSSRSVLCLHPRVAPFHVSVMPLMKRDPMPSLASDLAATLRRRWRVDMDSAGSIGKRYRRADEVGTPVCITVDPATARDGKVTLRDRDSAKQTRVTVEELTNPGWDFEGMDEAWWDAAAEFVQE